MESVITAKDRNVAQSRDKTDIMYSMFNDHDDVVEMYRIWYNV